jgi:hypothetical protein
MTAYEALSLMILFTMFVLALTSLLISILIKIKNKK